MPGLAFFEPLALLQLVEHNDQTVCKSLAGFFAILRSGVVTPFGHHYSVDTDEKMQEPAESEAVPAVKELHVCILMSESTDWEVYKLLF